MALLGRGRVHPMHPPDGMEHGRGHDERRQKQEEVRRGGRRHRWAFDRSDFEEVEPREVAREEDEKERKAG